MSTLEDRWARQQQATRKGNIRASASRIMEHLIAESIMKDGIDVEPNEQYMKLVAEYVLEAATLAHDTMKSLEVPDEPQGS